MTETNETEPEFDVLAHRFKHHAPMDPLIANRFAFVREMLLGVARNVEQLCPAGRERECALVSLESTMFWANAAIARNQDVVLADMQVSPVEPSKREIPIQGL